MAAEVKPIRSKADYEDALKQIERLWGAKAGTRKGDRLDVLATLIDAYEAEHYPIDPPDPIEAIKFRMEQQGLPPHRLFHLRGVTGAEGIPFRKTAEGQFLRPDRPFFSNREFDGNPAVETAILSRQGFRLRLHERL